MAVGGRPARGPGGGPRRRSSVDGPMCSYGWGSIRACSGTTLGVLGTSKMKENERFYGFTDFRGPAAHRGRDSRATTNQVTAGLHITPASAPLGAGLGLVPSEVPFPIALPACRKSNQRTNLGGLKHERVQRAARPAPTAALSAQFGQSQSRCSCVKSEQNRSRAHDSGGEQGRRHWIGVSHPLR